MSRPHTTHHDDCGCLTERLERAEAALRRVEKELTRLDLETASTHLSDEDRSLVRYCIDAVRAATEDRHAE